MSILSSCHKAIFLMALQFGVVAAHAQDWTGFRGPNGNGHIDNEGVPISWGGIFDRPVWQVPVPGQGHSSPIVLGDRIWMTSSERIAMSDADVEARLSKYPYDQDDFQTHGTVRLLAIELNANTGAILRRIDLFQHDHPAPIHASNSYASPTPVSDGRLIICHFGSLGTACIDASSGRVLWQRTLHIEELTGPGGSPVIWKDLIAFSCDGMDSQFVVALDKWTGETRWKTDRPIIDSDDGTKKRAFSTPILVESHGKTQLISNGAQWLVSYDPNSGAEWWRAKIGNGHACVPQPVFCDGIVYACTGYMRPELVAVKTDGSGDVTSTHIGWRYTKQVPEISSPIVIGNEIYFVSSMGVMSCVDRLKGELIWQQRIPGNYAASLSASGNRIYATSKEGITTVIQAGRKFEAISKNEQFGETWASLAVYQDRFLIRTDPVLFCIGK